MRAALRLRCGLLGTLALAGLPAPVAAQPVGSEFLINTYTTGGQRTRNVGGRLVASDSSGNFVVVWRSCGASDCGVPPLQDGSYYGIFGQRFTSGGSKLGGEFQVNSYTTGYQVYPSVSSAANGDFVVVWQSDGQENNYSIFGQRYDSGGARLGGEFRVNTYTTGRQADPSVASDASGNFVVAWNGFHDGSGTGVFAQRYDSTGGKLGSEFRVNSYTTFYQRLGSIASDAAGNFVVVWTSPQDGGGPAAAYGIFGQRYDSDGAKLGGEFHVNAYTTGYQRLAFVASNGSGDFVVVWSGVGQGDASGIFGRRFDSGGMAQGGQFRVNTYTPGTQYPPRVAVDEQANFVVTWDSVGPDGDGYGVFARRYDSGGVAQGAEFQVNVQTQGAQAHSSPEAIGANQFVVVWEGDQDGGYTLGIFGRRFDFAGLPSLSISDVSVQEGNLPGRVSGNFAVFEVTLSAPSTQSVTVAYITADGTATAPSDYTAKSGTLTFSPGQTSGVIAIRVKEDNLSEGHETFFVNLNNPTNATIADGQGVGTILNDDP